MRAGRSYLKAHKDWRDPDGSSLCPRCEEEEESFKHVITVCPALAEARIRHSEFSLIFPQIQWFGKRTRKDGI